MIHFLVRPSLDLTGLDDWDPDAEPARFASGEGHNVLELHRRLAQRGRATTVGPDIPPGTTLVVVMTQPIARSGHHTRIRAEWALRRHPVVAIRSDCPVEVVRRFRADVEVAPSRAFLAAHGARGRCVLAPLPQRGLRRRDPARGDRIEVATMKSNPENVPGVLRSPKVLRDLEALGVTLDLDVPSVTHGADQTWHDFSGADVAICLRRSDQEIITKPATKIFNAWAAGVVPIASREPAYEEVATDGVDVLFVDDPAEVVGCLRSLVDDPALRARLRQGVAEAAAARPSVDDLVDEWWALFVANDGKPSWWRGVRSVAFMARHEAPVLVRAAWGRAVRRLRRSAERP